MPGLDWGAIPPEIIAGQLMAGDNGASTAAAAAAHEALAAMLATEGASMGVTTAGTAETGWEGLGGTAMLATAAPYVAALEALSAWVQQSAASAAAMEQAYATAKASVIQVPVCNANRTDQASAVLTNFFGFRTPEIIALDTEYFGHFWTQNASIMGAYEGIVSAIMAALGLPPPPAPLTANPAGPAAQAAAIGEAAAQGAANAGMNASLQGVNDATTGTQAGAQTAAGPAQSMMSSAPQMLGQLGQLPQMMGQLPQMLGQFPQMLSQFPQMAMGMLGPLAGGMNANAADAAALDKAGSELAPVPAGGDAAARGGGGGAGGAGSGAQAMSAFTRPTSSFNAPGPPKLPAGWSATPAVSTPQVATSAQPAMGGGAGGLYGAPPMSRDDRAPEGATSGRTLQLTTGPGTGRGE
jgi:PPE-repeat protein